MTMKFMIGVGGIVLVSFAGGMLYTQSQGSRVHQSTPAADTTAAHAGHAAASPAMTMTGGAKRLLFYRDPMHPAYTSPNPGKAPDCGMELVPVYEEDEPVTVTVPGLAMITISPERQQLIGVTMGIVTRQPIEKTIRTVGRVEYDE